MQKSNKYSFWKKKSKDKETSRQFEGNKSETGWGHFRRMLD